MPTVTVDYFGMSGTGKNVTEAKKDAGRKIEKALDGSYTPTVVKYRDNAVLVYRSPDGWHTAVIASSEEGVRENFGWSSAELGDYADVVGVAKNRVAMLGWTHEDGPVAPSMLPQAYHYEFIRWAKWQIRYKAGRDAGLSDNDAHSFAGRNPARPELTNAVPAETLAALGASF